MSLEQLEDLKDEFMGFMQAFDNDDLPDDAWWCLLEECAQKFLDKHKIKYDSNSATYKFLIWRSK